MRSVESRNADSMSIVERFGWPYVWSGDVADRHFHKLASHEISEERAGLPSNIENLCGSSSSEVAIEMLAYISTPFAVIGRACIMVYLRYAYDISNHVSLCTSSPEGDMPASITSNGRMGIFPRKQHEECFEGEGIEGGLSCANRDQKKKMARNLSRNCNLSRNTARLAPRF